MSYPAYASPSGSAEGGFRVAASDDGPGPKEIGSSNDSTKKPTALWLYLVGVLLVGTYAAMYIPAFAGDKINPQTGFGSLLWTSLFFYLWWKRLGKKGWIGALIGAVLGIVAFTLAAFLSGFMGTGVPR